LNQVLEEHRFDEFVEGRSAPFYAERMGRPPLEPGCYFRLLLFRYFEGIDSERGIAWQAVGIEGTTLEANPAMRSIVRHDTGESYEEFLGQLAQESGISAPRREQVATPDRKRANKGSKSVAGHARMAG
jgi:transposase